MDSRDGNEKGSLASADGSAHGAKDSPFKVEGCIKEKREIGSKGANSTEIEVIQMNFGQEIDGINWRVYSFDYEMHVTPLDVSKTMPHYLDGMFCWCEPELTYWDNETNKRIFTHRQIQ